MILPTAQILPDIARKGVVINLPELRLYYFHEDKEHVSIYPIGIGRSGWETPVMQADITEIRHNPTWTPPASIRKASADKGIYLPQQMPAGPDNPLGSVAMRLGQTNILIHGNANPEGVGRRVSAGCIRLYETHIQELANLVSKGTSVTIINQPIKWGLHKGEEIIEAHRPLPVVTTSSTATSSAIQNTSNDKGLLKARLHTGFLKAERIAGISARQRAERHAYRLRLQNRLFTGLPKRIKE